MHDDQPLSTEIGLNNFNRLMISLGVLLAFTSCEFNMIHVFVIPHFRFFTLLLVVGLDVINFCICSEKRPMFGRQDIFFIWLRCFLFFSGYVLRDVFVRNRSNSGDVPKQLPMFLSGTACLYLFWHLREALPFHLLGLLPPETKSSLARTTPWRG